MGFISDVADKVRSFFRFDKERVPAEFAQGGVAATFPQTSKDLLSTFGYDAVAEYLRLEHDLLGRYADYESMNEHPELASALDIFADDSTQIDTSLNRTVWVTSKDRDVQTLLDDLFHRTLRMDEEAWEIARSLCLYGTNFEELLVSEDGVRGLNFLPQPTTRRVEGPRGQLLGFLQDIRGKFGYSIQDFQELLQNRLASRTSSISDDQTVALEDWEVAHFRLRGSKRRSPYGESVLEPARWIWKRLCLLEDTALIYRLQRAPERFAFYVDVGDLPPAEALAYLNRVRQQHRKRKYVNPVTGKLDLKFDPMPADDDFFIPSRKGQDGTRIEVLGSPQWTSMEDIEYFRNKLLSAIKVPKAYLGLEEGVVRAVLSSEDVRFARSVLRVQRELRNGFGKIARVHMAALGVDPQAVDYDIHMTVPSAIFELAQLEVRNARADLAGRMQEFVSLHWMLSRIFGLADEEIEQIIKEKGEDAKRVAKDQAGAEAEAQSQFGPPPGEEAPPEEAPPEQFQQPEQKALPRIIHRPPAIHSLMVERRTRGRRSPSRPITERELLRGNQEAEKRAEGKMERLLRNDARLARRLNEIGGLLHDLRSASVRTGGKR